MIVAHIHDEICPHRLTCQLTSDAILISSMSFVDTSTSPILGKLMWNINTATSQIMNTPSVKNWNAEAQELKIEAATNNW